MKKDCVVLFSGGIDSYIHLCWAERNFDNVTALYVNLGHRYAERELAACGELLLAHPRIKFDARHFTTLGDYELPNGFIPSRNMYLIQLAANYSPNIVFGTLHHESAPDHRRPFIKKLEQLIQTQYTASEYVTRSQRVRVIMPFDFTKTELVEWYLQTVSPVADRLHKTVACYQEHANCGRCRSCLNRWAAFVNNNLPPEAYTDSPYHWAAYKAEAYYERRHNGERMSFGVWWYNRRYIHELVAAFEKWLNNRSGISNPEADTEAATRAGFGYVLGTGAR